MSTAVQNVLDQALQLSAQERIELADMLAANLGESFGSEQDRAILELLEKRRADYLAGRAEMHTAEEVSARAWAMLK